MSVQEEHRALSERFHSHTTIIPGCAMCCPLAASLKLAESVVAAPVSVTHANPGSLSRCVRDNGHEINVGELMLMQRMPGHTYEVETFCIRQNCITPAWIVTRVPLAQRDSFLNLLRGLGFTIIPTTNASSSGANAATNPNVASSTSTESWMSASDRFSSFPGVNSNSTSLSTSASNPFMTEFSHASKKGLFADYVNVGSSTSAFGHHIDNFASFSSPSTFSNQPSVYTTINPLSRSTSNPSFKGSMNGPFYSSTSASNPYILPKSGTSASIGSLSGSTLYSSSSIGSFGTIGSYPSFSSSASMPFSSSMGAAPAASTRHGRSKSGRPMRRISSRPSSRSSSSEGMTGGLNIPATALLSGDSSSAFTFGTNASVSSPTAMTTPSALAFSGPLSGTQPQPFIFGAPTPASESTRFAFNTASSTSTGLSTSVSRALSSASAPTTASTKPEPVPAGAPSTPIANRKQTLVRSQTSFSAFACTDTAISIDGMETAPTTSFLTTPEMLHERFAYREASSPTKGGFTSSRSLELDLNLAGKMVISPVKNGDLPREKIYFESKGKIEPEKLEERVQDKSPGLSGMVRRLSVRRSPPERPMDDIEVLYHPHAMIRKLTDPITTTTLDFDPLLSRGPATLALSPTAAIVAFDTTPIAQTTTTTVYNLVAGTSAPATTTATPASIPSGCPDVAPAAPSTSTHAPSSTSSSQLASEPAATTFAVSICTQAKKVHKERLVRRRVPDELAPLAEEAALKRVKQTHGKPGDDAQAKWTWTEASSSTSHDCVPLASDDLARSDTIDIANVLRLDFGGDNHKQRARAEAPYVTKACICPKPAFESKLPIDDPLAILVSKNFIITRTRINHVFLTAFEMLDEPRACMRPWCSKIINESMENKEPAMVIYWVDMAKEEQPIDLKDSEAGEERVQEQLEMERPWQPDVAKKSYKYHQKEETSVFCCDSDCLNRNPRWLEALDKLSPFAVWANDDRIIGQAILDVLDMAQATGLHEPPPWWTTARTHCSSATCRYIKTYKNAAQKSTRKAAEPEDSRPGADNKGSAKKARKRAPLQEMKGDSLRDKSQPTSFEGGEGKTSVVTGHIARSHPMQNFQTVAEPTPVVTPTKAPHPPRPIPSQNLKSKLHSVLSHWPVDRLLDPRTPEELRVIRREATERLRLLHVFTVDEVKTALYRTFSLGGQIPGTSSLANPARRSAVPSLVLQQHKSRQSYLTSVRGRGLPAELMRQLQLVEQYKPGAEVQLHLSWPVLGSPTELLPNWMAQKARLLLEPSLRYDMKMHLAALRSDLTRALSTGSDPECPPALWPLRTLQYSQAALELPTCRSDEYLVIAWESYLERNYLAAKIFSARYCEAKASEKSSASRR